jgi:hypothetical protein
VWGVGAGAGGWTVWAGPSAGDWRGEQGGWGK